MVGLAVGDALGAPYEGQSRGSIEVRGFSSGGPFHLPAGAWTDDTSMALCVATSLVETGAYNPADVMERLLAWWRRGELSSIGYCFDVGNTTSTALATYEVQRNPLTAAQVTGHNAGNGAIVRLPAIPLAYSGMKDWDKALNLAVDQAALTHGGTALGAAMVYAYALLILVSGGDKGDLLRLLRDKASWHTPTHGELLYDHALRSITRGDYLERGPERIVADGYAVHSLEAALWAFNRGRDYADVLRQAVALGADTDSVGCIAGALAGAYYGVHNIPYALRTQVYAGNSLHAVAEALYAFTHTRTLTHDLVQAFQGELKSLRKA